jgi:acyl carrier protein
MTPQDAPPRDRAAVADQEPADPAVKFADIVADVLEVDAAMVTDTAGPDTLASWTSLRHLQLVVTLEEAYGLSFSYHEIRNLKSIGSVRDVLRAKGAAV